MEAAAFTEMDYVMEPESSVIALRGGAGGLRDGCGGSQGRENGNRRDTRNFPGHAIAPSLRTAFCQKRIPNRFKLQDFFPVMHIDKPAGRAYNLTDCSATRRRSAR